VTTPWSPPFTLTPAIAADLMAIEAARVAVARTPLSPAAEAELRHQARVRATHFSTRIEGNRLTLAEAREVVEGRRAQFHGRARDVGEVRNYWRALLQVEAWAADGRPFNEQLVRRLHALVHVGPRAKASAYRDGQNAVRDAATGALVYLPPEAGDVPGLMAALVAWVQAAERERVPVPVVAGLAHYQLVTIHPFFDGNGRTARLLATFLLHRGGYGLNGYFSLEEHHARDLDAYYGALVTHPHHNYYEGRATADLTGWLAYFVGTVADVFQAAEREATRLAASGAPPVPDALRRLDPRARRVLGLFADRDRITAADVAAELALSDRMARVLLADWVADGWLTIAEPSRKRRSYELSAIYRQSIGGLSATPPEAAP
jgi:Fic family protein